MSGLLLVEYVPQVERLSVSIQERGRAFGFTANDIRGRFFNGASNSLTMYAVSLTLIHAAQQFGRGDFTVVVDGHPHATKDALLPRVVDALFKDQDLGGITLWNSYLGKLKEHLFHEAWGTFEDALRRTYNAVVPLDQRRKDADLDATAGENNNAQDRRQHIHVGLPRVWLRLSRMTKANGTTKADRRRHAEVVEFLGAARNTMHSNTFYEGTDRSLVIGEKTLRLIHSQPRDFLHIDTILMLVDELVGAFEFLCRNVKHEAEITSPACLRDPLQDWPAVNRP